MKGRKNLTERERYYIEKMTRKKIPVIQIAKDLNCSRQTIYNEIKRGTVIQTDGTKDFTTYAYDAGQRIHDERRKKKGCRRKLDPGDDYLKTVARWILNERHSPYAAQCRVGRTLCVKSIYNYLHAGLIEGVTVMNLPYAKSRKKKQKRKGKLKWNKGLSIEQRPEDIKDRNQYGHWEMDTVYSSRDDLHCLLVLTERMTREELIIRMKNRTAKETVRAINGIERRIGSVAFREKFRTITCDNGVEFSGWEQIERCRRSNARRTSVYFCHPYCSCERGSNENLNRMIRRWIPKGDDIGLYSIDEIKRITDWINDYPRAIFGGMSANEYKKSVKTCPQISTPRK